MPKRDPHDILGVERGAGMTAVKAAWRRLARAHHPDLSATDPAAARAATARMAEINAAYDQLVSEDAERRAGLRGAEATGGPAGGADRPGPEAPPRRSAGPPPPRRTRPVTGRVDTSHTFRPRNTVFGSSGGARATSAAGPASAATPPRARPANAGPPRASDPTGPVRARRARGWTPPPEISLEDARAVELTFGKFHGHTLGQVADFEPAYIDWLATTSGHDPDLAAAARVIRRRLDELGIRRPVRVSRRLIITPD